MAKLIEIVLCLIFDSLWLKTDAPDMFLQIIIICKTLRDDYLASNRSDNVDGSPSIGSISGKPRISIING